MPVRVRCRCGQELVLRYSEWVYLLLGIVILCLLINTTLLVLFYLRLDAPIGGPHARRQVGPADLLRPAPAAPERPRLPPEPSAPVAPSPREKPGAPTVPSAEPVVAEPPGAPGTSPRPKGEPLTHRPPEERDVLREALVPRRPEGEAPAEGSSRPAAQRPPAPPWAGEGVLVRLAILEGSRDPVLTSAFLLDADSRLRQRALDRLGTSTGQLSAADAVKARALIEAAPREIQGDGRTRKLLESLGNPAAGSPTPGAGGGDPQGILESLRGAVERKLEEEALGALSRCIAERANAGLDVVLLVDVSRSMEGAFEALRRESLWLFEALPWASTGFRMGLVLYRDGVELALDFTAAPSGDLLRMLRETRPEGGGDVPEGVHEAVEAALSLGRMRWRPGAERHIVLIGDAPPPFPEVARLRILASQAFRQGAYRLHVLGVRPEPGAELPFLPAIARGAGGRGLTLDDPARLGIEVLLCLFPPDAHPAVRGLAGALREVFLPEEKPYRS
ncbi:MAG: VWA domain-containing protein [Planctomycetes bacterium]|nr:VWA domain-containing protein [Planctomycetota bacterium]